MNVKRSTSRDRTKNGEERREVTLVPVDTGYYNCGRVKEPGGRWR